MAPGILSERASTWCGRTIRLGSMFLVDRTVSFDPEALTVNTDNPDQPGVFQPAHHRRDVDGFACEGLQHRLALEIKLFERGLGQQRHFVAANKKYAITNTLFHLGRG